MVSPSPQHAPRHAPIHGSRAWLHLRHVATQPCALPRACQRQEAPKKCRPHSTTPHARTGAAICTRMRLLLPAHALHPLQQ
eukprot:11157700-Lingulodinium_polyedra.AAC.1